MTKYCTRCGAPNQDDAKFCSSCGSQFTVAPAQQTVQQSPQQPQQPAGQQAYQAQPQYQGRAERALNMFTRNLSLILPMIILFVLELIVGAIVGAAILVAFLHRGFPGTMVFYSPLYVYVGVLGSILTLVFWLLSGVFLAMVVVEARNASLSQGYNLSEAWAEVRSKIYDVALVAIILGIVNTVLGLVPFVGWLLEALFFAYVVVVECLIFTEKTGAIPAFSGALKWITSMMDRDALTLVVLIVAAILSEIPILNFFAVPYAALISLIYLFDIQAPPSNPPSATPS